MVLRIDFDYQASAFFYTTDHLLLEMANARTIKRIVPLLVICGLAYINYAACYIVGHNELYRHHLRGAAFVLWILLGILETSLFLYWGLILLRGPAKCPQIQPFDIHNTGDPLLLPLPLIFVCDKQGYPFWCGTCQSIKPSRLFHLNDTRYCCLRFDHYCLWIGSSIGRDNQVPFIKFVCFFDAFFILILACVASTTRLAFKRSKSNLPHYIILYVLCLFWILMTLILLVMQLVYITKNWTTIDEITIRQALKYSRWERRMRKRNYKTNFFSPAPPRTELGIRYVNVAHEGRRVVVSYRTKDLAFSQGFQINLINLMLNGNRNDNLVGREDNASEFMKALLLLLVPYVDIFMCKPRMTLPTYDDCSDEFSPFFIDNIKSKIKEQKFELPLYDQTTKAPEEPTIEKPSTQA